MSQKMSNRSSDTRFLPPIAPVWASMLGGDLSVHNVWDAVPFDIPDAFDEDGGQGFCRPSSWSLEATAVFSEEAALAAIPEQSSAVEENTVPSWLWRHQSTPKMRMVKENDARAVFHRFVGAATYKAWKEGLFANEAAARVFYTEAVLALVYRFLVIDPSLMNKGGEWAYGIRDHECRRVVREPQLLTIDHKTIDAFVSGGATAFLRQQWKKNIQRSDGDTHVRFVETERHWGGYGSGRVALSIDLMACRCPDGRVNADAVIHLTRLAVLLSDLMDVKADDRDVGLGFHNRDAFLAAASGAGLSIDRPEKAVAHVSVVMALVTAVGYETSAILAALRGSHPSYHDEREGIARKMANHRAVISGDPRDCIGMAIVPQGVSLQDVPDLALVARAQDAWDQACRSVALDGVRHFSITALGGESARFRVFAESETMPRHSGPLVDDYLTFAAALQSVTSGRVHISLDVGLPDREMILMRAWRLGIESCAFYGEGPPDRVGARSSQRPSRIASLKGHKMAGLAMPKPLLPARKGMPGLACQQHSANNTTVLGRAARKKSVSKDGPSHPDGRRK